MNLCSPSCSPVPRAVRLLFLTIAATDAYSPLWLLLVQTGMRRGEALGVRWQDVDLDTGKLRVRQCIEVLDNRPHIQTPKSPAALRTITLFPESVAALRAHRARQLQQRIAASGWQDHDLVFATPTGGPLNPRNVLHALKNIQRVANGLPRWNRDKPRVASDAGTSVAPADALPDFDIHDLRHTHATHLLQAAWSIPTVSRRLGHANPGITMTIYAHALSDTQGEADTTPAAFAFTGIA